ncbi:hypothetical protein RUND412_001628 [Rhizina undulata]
MREAVLDAGATGDSGTEAFFAVPILDGPDEDDDLDDDDDDLGDDDLGDDDDDLDDDDLTDDDFWGGRRAGTSVEATAAAAGVAKEEVRMVLLLLLFVEALLGVWLSTGDDGFDVCLSFRRRPANLLALALNALLLVLLLFRCCVDGRWFVGVVLLAALTEQAVDLETMMDSALLRCDMAASLLLQPSLFMNCALPANLYFRF